MIAPYDDVGFSTGKVGTRGTDKSVPYKVRCKNTASHYRVARQIHSFLRNFDKPVYRNNRIRSSPNAPLKKLKNNAAVADEFVEFIGYINLRIEAAAEADKLTMCSLCSISPSRPQCPAQCRQRPRDISAKRSS